MEFVLNNRTEYLDADVISLQDLINLRNYTFKMLVTKLNGKLIRKEEREETFIKNGDEVAILHLMSGG